VLEIAGGNKGGKPDNTYQLLFGNWQLKSE
jgi:hypothetical protein